MKDRQEYSNALQAMMQISKAGMTLQHAKKKNANPVNTHTPRSDCTERKSKCTSSLCKANAIEQKKQKSNLDTTLG
jgi:hypothetical protein